MPDAGRILLRNVYGWFERTQPGWYRLTGTLAAWRILETTHPPTYYLPVSAFKPGALIRSDRRSFCEWKGTASYFSVLGGDHRETDAAWGYPDPTPANAPLRGHVAVYAGQMESCWIDDERVTPQPGGFYGAWITEDLIGPFRGTPGTEFW